MFIKNFKVNYVVVLLVCLLAVSCSNTSVKESWMLDDHEKYYRQPMIIGISDSQQTRRIYEDYMVAELKKKGINAVVSYTLINSKQTINRETVVNVVKGSEIDAVLVSYLVSADTEVVHRVSPLNTGYSGNVENDQISETLISSRGKARREQVVVLKNDLYDTQLHTLVWSLQTESVSPKSIDDVIIEVTELLIEELFDDNLLK